MAAKPNDNPNSAAPATAEWRKLYEVMAQVKELAPWEVLLEDEIFGVQNPETGEVGFISIMGARGEHLSVAVYRGAAALHQFLDLPRFDPDDEDDDDNPGMENMGQRLLEIPQLQASFEDRDLVRQEDRAVMKKLGVKFRGAQAWPLFRDYSPGLFPWFINGADARFLTHVLEQVLAVVPRAEADEDLLWPETVNDFLVRVPDTTGGKLQWRDEVRNVPRPSPAGIRLEMDMALLEQAKELPHSTAELQLELMMMPGGACKDDDYERPFFPYILLMVDGESGMVLGTELLQPLPSLQAMWGRVALHVVKLILRMGAIPSLVRVRSDLLVGLLHPLAPELQFQIKQSARMPGMDEALDFLMQMPLLH